MNAYFGYGGQLNSRKKPAEIGSRINKNVISFGPAVNAGIEYQLPTNQLSVFIDAGGYLEFFPKFFLAHPQINGGVRLNIFK